MQQLCSSSQLSVYPVGDETLARVNYLSRLSSLFFPLCSLLLFFLLQFFFHLLKLVSDQALRTKDLVIVDPFFYKAIKFRVSAYQWFHMAWSENQHKEYAVHIKKVKRNGLDKVFQIEYSTLSVVLRFKIYFTVSAILALGPPITSRFSYFQFSKYSYYTSWHLL